MQAVAQITNPGNRTKAPACPSARTHGKGGTTMTTEKAAAALALYEAARALIFRLDEMTSDEFTHGGEQSERETLRAAVDAYTTVLDQQN